MPSLKSQQTKEMNAFIEIICSIHVDSLRKKMLCLSANLGSLSLKGKVFLKITMF